MNYYGITDVGKIRKDNQDTFRCEVLPTGEGVLAVVCDGMGGVNGGSIASALAADTFVSVVLERFNESCAEACIAQLLQEAAEDANKAVYEKAGLDITLRGMGTTLVAAVTTGDYAMLVNIGDSRAYIITESDGIRQITRDHSVVEDLVSLGNITREEAKNHPNKNLITRAIGTSPECKGDLFKVKLNENDRILLCSDGLSNIIEDDKLLEYAGKYDDLKQCCDELLEYALELGAPDNVTAVLLSI